MSIDQSKLENAVRKDGKVTARCPACESKGSDKKGEHLVIYDSGAFGCVAYPDDKEHNKEIMKAAGIKGKPSRSCRTIKIKPKAVAERRVLMELGRIGQVKPSSSEATG